MHKFLVCSSFPFFSAAVVPRTPPPFKKDKGFTADNISSIQSKIQERYTLNLLIDSVHFSRKLIIPVWIRPDIRRWSEDIILYNILMYHHHHRRQSVISVVVVSVVFKIRKFCLHLQTRLINPISQQSIIFVCTLIYHFARENLLKKSSVVVRGGDDITYYYCKPCKMYVCLCVSLL